MTEEQQRIAVQCIADVVRNSMNARKLPPAEEVREMALSAAKALAAALRELDEAAKSLNR